MTTHLPFYEAAAGIIPVLGLVVVVDQRGRKETFVSVPTALWGLLVLVVGEWASLHVLLRGRANASDQWWVIVSLGIATVAILQPAVADLLGVLRTARAATKPSLWRGVVVQMVFMVAVIVWAIART